MKEIALALTAFSICCPVTATLAAIVYIARNAPIGYEDDAGWHNGSPAGSPPGGRHA